VIELSEMIAELRRELYRAIEAGHDEQLRFSLGPASLACGGHSGSMPTAYPGRFFP
jgi:hypothetical protein